MEVNLTSGTESRLNELAASTGRGIDELVEEAVHHMVMYNKWFEDKVDEGMEALNRGAVISSDEIRTRFERRKGAR